MSKDEQVKELRNSIADYRVVKLLDLIPYWRNPWDNNASAVNAVTTSIEELTYYNPIIVDKDMTIICGHTRYKALKQLGVENVVVMVSDLSELEAKSYRIADNKTTELSNWLIDKVREEYAKLPSSKTLDVLFPTIMMTEPSEGLKPVETPLNASDGETRNIDDVEIELICPNCMNGITATWGDVKRMIEKAKDMEAGNGAN